MKCEVCSKEAKEGVVICSDHCAEVRLLIFKLIDKYFPMNGCENCLADLHQGCTEQCKKESRECGKFATDLWSLAHLINKDKEGFK